MTPMILNARPRPELIFEDFDDPFDAVDDLLDHAYWYWIFVLLLLLLHAP
jgi:hypothetical protein